MQKLLPWFWFFATLVNLVAAAVAALKNEPGLVIFHLFIVGLGLIQLDRFDKGRS